MPSIWFVWKSYNFLVAREQKLGARGHWALLENSPANQSMNYSSKKRIPLTKKICYKIINKMFIHIRAVGLSMLVCLVRPCSMFWYVIPPSSHVSTVNTAVFCFFWHSIGLNTLIPLVQPWSIFISMHAWLFVALTQSTA